MTHPALVEARSRFTSDREFQLLVEAAVEIAEQDCAETCGDKMAHGENGAATVAAAVLFVLLSEQAGIVWEKR